MPRRALEPGVTVFGQRLVIVGGFSTNQIEGLEIPTRVDTFDATDNTWGTLPDVPVRWTHPNIAAVGTTLYLAGGLEGSHFQARNAAYALDPLTQIGIRSHRWIRPTRAAPLAWSPHPAGFYLLGGASSTGALASCLEYDIAADRWTHLPDLPAPRSHLAVMRMADGTLIVAGGMASLDSSEPRGEVWALPPPGAMTREWQPRATMHQPTDPETRGGCAYGVVLGELVCAGGAGSRAARNVVESYDPVNNIWTTREPLPVERAGAPGAAIGGRLFVVGGAGQLTFEPTIRSTSTRRSTPRRVDAGGVMFRNLLTCGGP